MPSPDKGRFEKIEAAGPRNDEGGAEEGSGKAAGGPVVIEVMGNEGSPQSLRVKPATFLSLVERLDHPVVAHYKTRFGKHVYFVYCGDFIIEARTRRALDLGRATAAVGDRIPAGGRRGASGRAVNDILEDSGGWSGIQSKHRLMEFYCAERCYVAEWWSDRDLSVARLRVEKGMSTRPYRLRGISERYLFLSGRGVVDVDGTEKGVGPGDGLLINPGSWRCITNTGDRDLGLFAICRPRFRRLDPHSPRRDFAGAR